MRIVVILVFLIIMVGGAYFALRNMTGGSKGGENAGPGITQGIVAAVTIPPGGVLNESIVMTIQNPSGFPKEVATSVDEIRGAVVTEALKTGEPILKTDLEKRKVKSNLLTRAEMGMRMLVLHNVNVPPTVPLIPKSRVEAVVDMHSARLASDIAAGAPGTANVSHRPIIMTILYAPERGENLWEGEEAAEGSGGGRDLLVAAPPFDATRIGQASKENTLSIRPISALIAVRKTGTTLVRLRERRGITLSDINPHHNKDEDLAKNLITNLLKPEQEQTKTPTSTSRPPQTAKNWHWEYRFEEIVRDIEIWRGKELTKVQVPAGTRRVRVKVWNTSAPTALAPQIRPLPPVITMRANG